MLYLILAGYFRHLEYIGKVDTFGIILVIIDYSRYISISFDIIGNFGIPLKKIDDIRQVGKCSKPIY